MSPGAPAPPYRRFPRSGRLKRRRLIRALFDRRHREVGTVAAGSIRMLYRVVAPAETSGAPVQVGFAVGRHARPATRRNRVRRVLREVYRVHQQDLIGLFSHGSRSLTLMVLFRGNLAEGTAAIATDLPAALRRLVGRLGSEGRTGTGGGAPGTAP